MIKSKKSIICLVASLGLISVVNTTPVQAKTTNKSVQTSESKSSSSKVSNLENKLREYVSKVNNLNVRSAAKSNAKVLGKLKKGDVIVGLQNMMDEEEFFNL